MQGLSVWMRELDELISNQISSYRMNVESELLAGLIAEETSGIVTSGEQVSNIQLSDSAMGRLQNNVSRVE